MQPLPGRRCGGAFNFGVLAEASPHMSPAPPPVIGPQSPKMGFAMPPTLHESHGHHASVVRGVCSSHIASSHPPTFERVRTLSGQLPSRRASEDLEGSESTTSGLVRQVSPYVLDHAPHATHYAGTAPHHEAHHVVASPQGATKYVVLQGQHVVPSPHHGGTAPRVRALSGQLVDLEGPGAHHERPIVVAPSVYVLASPTSAGQHPHPAAAYVAMPSPSGARPVPAPPLPADELSAGQPQLFHHQMSGGMGSPLACPQSPAWAVVTKPQKRRSGAAEAPPLPEFELPDSQVPAAAAPSQAPDLNRLRSTGDAVDLYHDQKELFGRAWQRGDKQSFSTKAKKKTDYQVEKRRQQSSKDKERMLGGGGDDLGGDI